jgi:lipopolysaccharide export system permease protein
MRLLDRYLLREMVVPFAYCLGGFVICWIAFDLFAEMSELQEKMLRPLDIAQLYLVRAPGIMVLLMPVALLLSLLYSLTNHARHNEITAIRASGMSLWRLSAPYFAVGFASAVLLFVLNEYVVPDGEEAAERIKRKYVGRGEDLPAHQISKAGFTNTREGRVWQAAIYDTTTGEMRDPRVIWKRADGARVWIQSDRAFHTNNMWAFENARQFVELPGKGAELAPLAHTNLLLMPFSETPEEINSEIKITYTMTFRALRRAEIPISAIMDYNRLHPNPRPADRAWLDTKLHGRMAAPLTCMVVVLIALPFGAASGRRNVFVGVASSIVICFIFFVMQQFGLAMGTGGYVPPWLAAWFPNIAFGLAGIWMTSRVR